MLILGVDTSSSAASLAVVEDGTVVDAYAERHRHPPSDSVFLRLEELLARCGRSLDELDAFAACVGPGSFTGLRIGLGMAKTFAFALAKPVVGVDAVEVAARRAVRAGAVTGEFSSVIHGFKRTTFQARYRTEGDDLEATSELAYHDDLESLRAAVAGGPVVVPAGFPFELPGSTAVPDEEPSAVILAAVAADRIARGETADFNAVQPLYLKPFGIGRNAKTPEDLR